MSSTRSHSPRALQPRVEELARTIVDGVAAGRYRPNVERVFRFDEIVAAHRFMEENRGSGKLVVAVDA